MSFISELKRRNVFRVVIAYLLGSWLLLQVADVLFGVLQLPEWSLTLVAAILALGFVPAVVVSWIYELTPDGLMRDQGPDFATPMQAQTSRKLDVAIVGLFVVTIGLLGWQLFDPKAVEPAEPSPVADTAPAAAQSDVTAGGDAPGTEPSGRVVNDRTSVAVLPFRDMSAAGDQAYFGEGIAEELINALVSIEELKVASRTSTFKLAGEDLAIPALAERLNVNHVLEGSIRTSGQRIRITAQLIDVSDDTHLWSETYDRELTDIFAVQDDIAARILEALTEQLGSALRPSAVALTASTEAYQRYLEGRHLWRKRSRESVEAAQVHFEAAVELDPDFHQAWSSLASTYFLLAVPDPDPFESENLQRAAELAQRALELEPRSGEALAILGVTEQFQCRSLEAAELLRRATEVGDGDPTPHHWYALLLSQLGHLDRAAEQARLGLDLDPLIPAIRTVLGYIEVVRGNAEIGLAHIREANEQAGTAPGLGELVMEALFGGGDPNARDAEYGLPAGDVEALRAIAVGTAAEVTLDRVGRNDLANALALHDVTEAIDLLLSAPCPNGSWFLWAPGFQHRDNPGFSELMRRLNAIEYWATYGPPDDCASLEPGLVNCDTP
ncbi:MAG: hypothetical protein AAGE01_21980 [Pseudomonadota bacterium]